MNPALYADAPGSAMKEPATPTRTVLSLQDQIFLFFSLMLVTCGFLPWRENGRTLFDLISDLSGAAPFLILALTVVCLTPFTTTRPLLRPWFGISTALVVHLGIFFLSALPGRAAYGAELARWCSLGLLILSANPAILKTGDLAMRRLNAQTAEVFTHWGTVLPGVHFSAQELYKAVEQEIQERQWPGVESLRATHSEAGLLSHKREYLRVLRQRQVFDLSAGTFGKDYFITLREAEIHAQLTLSTLIIFSVALLILLSVFLATFGLMGGVISFCVLLLAGVFLLFNVLRMGLTRLDGLLMRAPVIGPVYETWFRRSTTYFQHDTRMVFLKLMDELVKSRVDEATSAKGVTLLSCFEHQPILDGLYKTSTRVPKSSQ